MGNNSKTCAALSYLLIGIIWYFVDEKMKKDDFVKFHVKQALVLLVADIILQIAASFLWFVGWFLAPLIGIFILVLFILGLVNSLNGKKKELPLIGQFAKYFTF